MTKDDKKTLHAEQAQSFRGLVDKCNALGLQKEDILQVVPSTDGFFLLYFK